jgi:hypothetical protein
MGYNPHQRMLANWKIQRFGKETFPKKALVAFARKVKAHSPETTARRGKYSPGRFCAELKPTNGKSKNADVSDATIVAAEQILAEVSLNQINRC